MDKHEPHDGSVEGGHVATIDTVATLDVAALDAVDTVEELGDLDLGGAQLVRVTLTHRVVTVGHGNHDVGVGSLAGVGFDLFVEQTSVAFAQTLGALTGGQGDAEGARVRP